MGNRGNKNDYGKNRLDLIPPEAITALGLVLTHGAEKYGDRNWEQGLAYHRVYGAILRHLNSWADGEIHDPESRLPHLYHAFCELAFLVTYECRNIGTDDIHQKLNTAVLNKERKNTLWFDDITCQECKHYIECGITYIPKRKSGCKELMYD